MEDKRKDIEDLFRERFASAEAPVSPRVWQNIRNTLPPPVTGLAGMGAIKSIILWSVTTMITVAVAIGSYLYVTNYTMSSLTISTPAEPAFIKTGEKSNSSFIDSVNNNITHQTHPNSIDSISLQSSHRIITYNKDSQESLLSTTSSNKDIDKSLRKKIYSSNARSSPEALNKDMQGLSKEKHKSSEANNKWDAANRLNKEKKNNSSYTNFSDSITIDNQSNASRKNSLAVNNSKNNKSLSKKTTDILDSDLQKKSVFHKGKDTDSLSAANKYNTAEKEHANITLQNSKSTTLDLNNSNANLRSDLLQTSDSTIFVDKNNSIHKVRDSLTYTKDSSNLSTEISLHQSMLKSDSSSNIASSFNDKFIESSHTALDPKKENRSSTDTTDSSALVSDSLSNETLASSALLPADTLSLSLDSTGNTAKDSVLTDAVTKKEKSSSKLFDRLSFDLVGTVLLTGASTKATDTLYQSAIEDKNKKDKNSLGYSAGIIVNYKLSNRLQASAGIVYTSFSEQYNFNYNLKTTASVLIDSNWQSIEVDSINRDTKVKDHYSFISVPLQLSYAFLVKEKLRLSATVGIRSNILLKGVTYIPNANKSDVIEIKSGFNSISFSYLIALEAEYKLNDHAALLLQPTFMYGASSIHSKASSLSQKPYGMGLTLGLRFIF